MTLFSQCAAAKELLAQCADIRRKWTWSVEWLSDELERGRGQGSSAYNQGGGGGGGGGGGSYSYNNWSPPAQSNESVNGYFLERSHSARITLEKACELLPDEVRMKSWHIYSLNLAKGLCWKSQVSFSHPSPFYVNESWKSIPLTSGDNR